jgi:hypothetical protein
VVELVFRFHRHCTTIVPLIAWPCTAQSYSYVPSVVKVTLYVLPEPVRTALLAKEVVPSDSTL